jgi:hypothetical protein
MRVDISGSREVKLFPVGNALQPGVTFEPEIRSVPIHPDYTTGRQKSPKDWRGHTKSNMWIGTGNLSEPCATLPQTAPAWRRRPPSRQRRWGTPGTPGSGSSCARQRCGHCRRWGIGAPRETLRICLRSLKASRATQRLNPRVPLPSTCHSHVRLVP